MILGTPQSFLADGTPDPACQFVRRRGLIARGAYLPVHRADQFRAAHQSPGSRCATCRGQREPQACLCRGLAWGGCQFGAIAAGSISK